MSMKRATSFLFKLRSAAVTPQSSLSSSCSSYLARSFNSKAHVRSVEEVMREIPQMQRVRRGWVGKEDESCLYFRMDMPGLGEKHIKVAMEKNTNTLVIGGEIRECKMGFREAEEEDEEAVVRKYRATIEILPNFFKTDEIKSEINNGVLKVVVPKVDGAGKGEQMITFSIPNMDENPFLKGVRRNWSAEVYDGCLVVRIDMPGLVAEDVKLYRDNNTDNLIVEGCGEKECEYEGGGKRYIRCKVDNTNFFKTARCGCMENGVYLLVIPPLPGN